MPIQKILQCFAALAALVILPISPLHAGTVSGTLIKWHPLTVDFDGPQASETDNSPNPFLDYRLSVSLTAPSGQITEVPGFFAGNGQGAGTGSVWRIRFAPNEVGTWQYSAQFRTGNEVAISLDANAGQASELSGSSGSFTVQNRQDNAPGFLSQGRLNYVGEHYLRFDDGGYWLKGGTDSPENLLGYAGIDGTESHGGIEPNFLHRFATHEQDWRTNDPLFQSSRTGVDSRGLIGALNYLSGQGVNSVYLLPMNLGGDGQDSYPFVGAGNNRFDKTHYDISKLHQWQQVFSHAQRQSIFVHFVLSETERANERWLDNGALGVERKLFFRELVARFGYVLAAKWNLGEENDFPVSELRQHAEYLQAIDWSNKPITVHTQINDFSDYEQIVGDPLFSATSIQYDPEFASQFVERWRQESSERGHPWVLDMDENTGGVAPGNVNNRRKQMLYDVYFSGGQIEWYFGLHPLPLGGDINAENFRLREDLWNFTAHARNFMENELPFWEMEPADQLVTGEAGLFGGAEVFAKTGDIYAVYLPQATQAPRINLAGVDGNFTMRWYNPRNGQFEGATRTVDGGSNQALGSPPSSNNEDWVLLIKREGFNFSQPQPSPNVPVADETSDPDPELEPVPEAVQAPIVENSTTAEQGSTAPVFVDFQNPTAIPGQTLRFSVLAIDDDGVAPSMGVGDDLPSGMQIQGSGGVLDFIWPVPSEQTNSIAITVIAIDAEEPSSRTTLDLVVNIAQSTLPSNDAIDVEVNAEEINNDTDTTAGEVVEITPTLPTTNQAPFLLSLQNQAVIAGAPINIPVIALDPDGFVPNVWANNLPDGASLTDNGNGTRIFSWIPQSSQAGVHTIEFEVQDAIDATIQLTVPWQLEVFDQDTEIELMFEVINGNTFSNFAPLFAEISPQQVQTGTVFRLLVRPIDPEGIAPNVQLRTVLPGATFEDAGNGARELVWTPSDENIGVFTLDFIATDANDASLSTMSTVQLTVVGN